MSSSPQRNRYFSKASTRLAVYFTSGFAVCILVFYSLIYFQIQYVFEAQDRKLLQKKANEYASRINVRGLADFQEYFGSDVGEDIDKALLVRISSAQGGYLFQHDPAPSFEADERELLALQEKARETISFSRVSINRGLELGVAFTLQLRGGEVLIVIMPSSLHKSYLQDLRSVFLWSFLPMIIIAMLLSYFVTDKVMRPFRDVLISIKAINDGAFSKRIPVSDNDGELSELKLLFNGMLDRIEISIGGLREAFDHLAHDIRTPVTRLRGRAELALNNSEESVDTYREALQSCFENSDRILRFLDTLTQISEAENRSLKIKRENRSLGELVNEIMDLYEIAFEEKNISVSKDFSENDKADVDPNLVKRVIANLLDNAHKYTPEDGKVLISTFRTDKHIVLSVKDDGLGISSSEQALIWDRLFRGDKSRGAYGMGLGLTFVKAVIEAHGGQVMVKSPIENGRGTEFQILFKIPGLRLPQKSGNT